MTNTMLIVAGEATRYALDLIWLEGGYNAINPEWMEGSPGVGDMHRQLSDSGLSYVYLFDGDDEGSHGFDAYDHATGEQFNGTTDSDHMNVLVSCTASVEEIEEARRWQEFLQRMMNERTREFRIIEDEEAPAPEPDPTPTEPGYYWAGWRPGSAKQEWTITEVCKSLRRDRLIVFMPGTEIDFELREFEWGPRVPDYQPEED